MAKVTGNDVKALEMYLKVRENYDANGRVAEGDREAVAKTDITGQMKLLKAIYKQLDAKIGDGDEENFLEAFVVAIQDDTISDADWTNMVAAAGGRIEHGENWTSIDPSDLLGTVCTDSADGPMRLRDLEVNYQDVMDAIAFNSDPERGDTTGTTGDVGFTEAGLEEYRNTFDGDCD